MHKKTIIIFGLSHIAVRLKKKLLTNGYKVLHPLTEIANEKWAANSLLERIEDYLKDIEATDIEMFYLLDEKDDDNLEMIIALLSLFKNIPITASLFNEKLIPHLLEKHENLIILNPAKIAAPAFVKALSKPLQRNYEPIEATKPSLVLFKWKDTLINKLTLSFSAIIVLAIIFFKYTENLSWINSLYFVIVTVATVGFGDINLLNSPWWSKLFAVLLILSSTIFIWMIFSLTIDRVIKTRIQLALGRKKYRLTNHIIICGLGRLGYFIANELIKQNEKVLIIERNEELIQLDYLRQAGAEVYIGDARLPKVLSDVNIKYAKALYSVINNDSENLEIGLNGRSFQPTLRIILRIFDEQMAEKIKEHLNIHLTISASAIANDKFYEVLEKKV